MQPGVTETSQFVIDLLTTLRAERFSPRGWRRFLITSWNRAAMTARDHPALTRSWLGVTMLMVGLTVAVLLATLLLEGKLAFLRLLPGFILLVAWQQSDLFWHLGLNRHAISGKLLPRLGYANILTVLRGLCAGYLLARLMGGLHTSSLLVLAVLLAGITTDILDGLFARATHTQTRLGQLLDSATDFTLSLAVTIILLQNSLLPLWLGTLIILRFVVPLLAALASYFLLTRPVHFGSTAWGKYAGFVQCLYFLSLLAPYPFTRLTKTAQPFLSVVLVVLLIAAPLAQLVENWRVHP